jgi:hypothetical protein
VIGTGKRIENLIVPLAGFRSDHVALKLAELAELHGQVHKATQSLTPAQLEWQPTPDSNTVGMLLTHLALAEVHLGQVGLRGEKDGHVRDVLGIGVDDDGMPIEQFGGPPAALAGKPITFFADLLARANAHTRAACATLDDVQLAEEITRPPRPDGSYRVFDRRWVLHHLVEHMAQHLGQIQVLRRQWKAAQPGA